MPRILRIINRFNLGGITYNVSYLSRFLSADYETLLAGGPEEKSETSSLHIPHSLNLRPVVIEAMRRSLNPLSDLRAYLKIRALIKEFKPDIVHTHASKAGAIGRLAAIHCRVPVIVHTFHGHVFSGYFGGIKTAFVKGIERWLARRTDAIVAISDGQKKELVEKYKVCSPGQTHVIRLGFDLQRFDENQAEKRREFRNRFGVADNELAIGIVGRLAPIKNHFLFIDAIAEVQTRTSASIRALIIGGGEMESQLRNYAEAKKLTTGSRSVLIFAGWIKDVDVALAGLDIVCLTSKNEGTPVSLIEAQAAGKLVVATNVGGTRDILHHQAGLLSDPGDDASFRNNLLKAVDHFETLSRPAVEAKQWAMKTFSYDRLCAETESLYRTLLKSPRKG